MLSDTIGQHDAGGPMTGGNFELTGGFWAGAGETGCNIADLAQPFGQLDLADITTFVIAFLTLDPIADFDDNQQFDLADITAFVTAFLAGCP